MVALAASGKWRNVKIGVGNSNTVGNSTTIILFFKVKLLKRSFESENNEGIGDIYFIRLVIYFYSHLLHFGFQFVVEFGFKFTIRS